MDSQTVNQLRLDCPRLQLWKWTVHRNSLLFDFKTLLEGPSALTLDRPLWTWSCQLTFLWLWSHLNFFAGIFAKSSSKSSSESVEVESSFGWFHWIKIKWRIFWISKNKIVKTNKTDMNGRYDFVPPYFTFWLICWILLYGLTRTFFRKIAKCSFLWLGKFWHKNNPQTEISSGLRIVEAEISTKSSVEFIL